MINKIVFWSDTNVYFENFSEFKSFRNRVNTVSYIQDSNHISSKILSNIKEINPKVWYFSRIKVCEEWFNFNTILQEFDKQETIKFNFAYNKFAAKITFFNTYVKIVQKNTGNELFIYWKSLVFKLYYREILNIVKFSQIDKNSNQNYIHFVDVARVEFNEIEHIFDSLAVNKLKVQFPNTFYDSGGYHEVIVPFNNLKMIELNEWYSFLKPDDIFDGFDMFSQWKIFTWSLNINLDIKLLKMLISHLPLHCKYDLNFTKNIVNLS